MSGQELMNFGPYRDLTYEQARKLQPGFLRWGRNKREAEGVSGPLAEWLEYCDEADAKAVKTPTTGRKRPFIGAFDCPDHGPMAGPFTVRKGLEHNRGRQFYKCQHSGCGLNGEGHFRWADGSAPFSAESCRRFEGFHGAEENSVGVGPIGGLVADHLDGQGKPVGPWHREKRRRLFHDDDAVGEVDSDEEAERAEKLNQALDCRCMSCDEPHPDPEQLVEDDPEGCDDLPTKPDSNGWRVISDDWSRGICPDCREEAGFEDESDDESDEEG